MKILVTGAAGFIGSRITHLLALRGNEVMAVDNINDYYDIQLKHGRLAGMGFVNDKKEYQWHTEYHSSSLPNLHFIRLSLEEKESTDQLFTSGNFDMVVHMAAQAGVRYSVTHPYAYLASNLTAFLNILEACRHHPVQHLLFASSSSVYGTNDKVPFSEDDKTDTPISLYAATKKSNELMAHSYSKLYHIPVTGLRFFTVYGPWSRPDMAPMLFANAICEGKPINVFNNGDMIRDFTYIDDVANAAIQCLDRPPLAERSQDNIPFRVFNVGCAHPINLMDFIHEIERSLGKKAEMKMKPMQPGDLYQTYADISRLEKEIGYKPQTTLHEGISKFIAWYLSYYKNSV